MDVAVKSCFPFRACNRTPRLPSSQLQYPFSLFPWRASWISFLFSFQKDRNTVSFCWSMVWKVWFAKILSQACTRWPSFCMYWCCSSQSREGSADVWRYWEQSLCYFSNFIQQKSNKIQNLAMSGRGASCRLSVLVSLVGISRDIHKTFNYWSGFASHTVSFKDLFPFAFELVDLITRLFGHAFFFSSISDLFIVMVSEKPIDCVCWILLVQGGFWVPVPMCWQVHVPSVHSGGHNGHPITKQKM